MDIKSFLLGFIVGVFFIVFIKRLNSNKEDYSYKNNDTSDFSNRQVITEEKIKDMKSPLSEGKLIEIMDLKKEGSIVAAVKETRDATGWSLKESKEFVEKL